MAEATAFAAYKKLSIFFFSVRVCVYTKDFDKTRKGGCLREIVVAKMSHNQGIDLTKQLPVPQCLL